MYIMEIWVICGFIILKVYILLLKVGEQCNLNLVCSIMVYMGFCELFLLCWWKYIGTIIKAIMPINMVKWNIMTILITIDSMG